MHALIYGLEDIDRGADALNQAQKLGYKLGSRETLQLADGYRLQGDALDRAAATVKGMPQEKEFLERSRDAYKTSLEHYAKIADSASVPTQIRDTQRRMEAVERRRELVEGQPWYLPFSIPGTRLRPAGPDGDARHPWA